MTTDTSDIDRLFDAARGEAQEMDISDALMARIMSDAADQMPRRTGTAPQKRGLAALIAALGGWAAVSGLAAATVGGLWLGFSPPAALDTFLGGDTLNVSFDPQYYGFAAEG